MVRDGKQLGGGVAIARNMSYTVFGEKKRPFIIDVAKAFKTLEDQEPYQYLGNRPDTSCLVILTASGMMVRDNL